MIILCDIIKDRLPFNHLQRVIIERLLNHAILNKENQGYFKSEQLLFYDRGKWEVGKIRVLKAIDLKFRFLKKQKELLIAALIYGATAKTCGTTIHSTLSI